MKKVEYRYYVNGTHVSYETYSAVKVLQADFNDFEFHRTQHGDIVLLQLNTQNIPDCLTALVNHLVRIDCNLTYLEKYGV